MYDDMKNFYHYKYEKNGDQPGQRYDARSSNEQQSYYQSSEQPGSQQPVYQNPVQEMKPVKKKRTGLKIAALALACVLLGGAVGGGVAVFAMHRAAEAYQTEVNISNRTPAEVVVHEVDGKNEMSDAELYAANVNSAVSINVTGTSGTNFFGQPVQTASAGSGFVLTKDGYIVTNYHVVENADTVKVTMYNGDEYEAKYVGGDEDYDIAVIKVEAVDLQPVVLGDSDNLNVGDHVLAIGNPLGELTFSMSGGMVSSVNRAINVGGTPFNMIQTDASINSGNSGGPLFNSYGEVVGIVSAKYSASGSGASVEGLGFAIPINDVFAMIQDIMTNGYITNKPYLAITAGTMTEEMAAQYRYTIDEGVFVYSVEEGGAAQKAGLKMGDVIVKVDDNEIESMEDLTVVKKKYAAGDTVTLTIYRENQEMQVELTWDAVPADQQTAGREELPQTPQGGNQYGNQYGNGYGYFNPFGNLFGNFFGY